MPSNSTRKKTIHKQSIHIGYNGVKQTTKKTSETKLVFFNMNFCKTDKLEKLCNFSVII